MSLLRLLTTGKTLIGLKRPESRYQLPGRRGLPTFGSKKNPFRATVFPDKPELEPANDDSAASGGDSGPVAEGAPEMQPHQEHKPSDLSQAAADAAKETKESDKGQAPNRRTSAIRAFLLWRRVKKANLRGTLKGRPLVQAELSLETVKVVRNDLSESDLEVVQAPKKRIGPENLIKNPGLNPDPVSTGWRQTGEQLLSVAKP